MLLAAGSILAGAALAGLTLYLLAPVIFESGRGGGRGLKTVAREIVRRADARR
jgi:hypothetical protein